MEEKIKKGQFKTTKNSLQKDMLANILTIIISALTPKKYANKNSLLHKNYPLPTFITSFS